MKYLTFCDRVLEIIKLGRQEKNEPDVAALVDNLQKGNYYERLLALYSCYGSYNGERVLTAIQDDSRSINKKAIALITLVGSDAQVLAALKLLKQLNR